MNAAEITAIFSAAFPTVRILGGNDEPYYSPETDIEPATILFREDFAASALHEIAHWCIAGPARRRLRDFGYWYEPDRDLDAQRRFQQAEVAPQALEWIFTVATGRRFLVSFDYFDLPEDEANRFRGQVRAAVIQRLECGLPRRAKRFAAHLARRSGRSDYLEHRHYAELPC